MVRVVAADGVRALDAQTDVVLAPEGEGVLLAARRAPVTLMSQTLRDLFDDMDAGGEAPPEPSVVPVRGGVDAVQRVLCWCEYRAVHMDEVGYGSASVVRRPVVLPLDRLFVNAFDCDFINSILTEGGSPGSVQRLVAVLDVCNFLQVDMLKDVCVAAVSALVHEHRTAAAQRALFHLPTDPEPAPAAAPQWVRGEFGVHSTAAKALAARTGTGAPS